LLGLIIVIESEAVFRTRVTSKETIWVQSAFIGTKQYASGRNSIKISLSFWIAAGKYRFNERPTNTRW